jgi:hypothetical protein
MDYDYLHADGNRAFQRGKEMYAEIAVSIKQCAAIDKELTQELCERYIPVSWQSSYTRFVTGEILDNTLPALKDELRELHNLAALADVDTVFQGRKLAESRYGTEPIHVTAYLLEKNDELQFQQWHRTEYTFFDLAEYQHEVGVREKAGHHVLATLGKKRVYAIDKYAIDGEAPRSNASAVKRPEPRMGL